MGEAANQISDVFIPEYEILSILGKGASGALYLAKHKDKLLALKVIPKNQFGEHTEASYRKEVAALSRLRSPNIVKLFDSGQSDNVFYIATEYIEGQTLARLLEADQFNDTQVIQLALNLCEALTTVAKQGFVHRDIKPENIMIRPDGTAVLIDLGFAGDLHHTSTKATNEIVATLYYASPEQLGGLKRPVDQRSDLYSLGVVLYEALTGTKPFYATTLLDIIDKHVKETPPPAVDVRASISPVLSRIVAKLMAKDPDDRYQTAGQLAHDVQNISALGPDALGTLEVSKVAQEAFYGRGAEFKTLSDRWKVFLNGTAMPVLITGESGSGKSRLAQEFLKDKNDQAILLRAKFQELNPSPFFFFQEAFKHFLSDQSPSRQQARDKIVESAAGYEPYLTSAIPALTGLLGEHHKEKLKGTEESSEFTYALTEFFSKWTLNSQKRFILYLDDIQWADARSLDAVTNIAQQISATPVLILATAREGDDYATVVNTFAENFLRTPQDWLSLKPINTTTILEIIDSQLGPVDVAREVAEYIERLSRGNIYMIKEYLSRFIGDGILALERGVWVFNRVHLANVALPENIVSLMRSRLQNADSESLQILRLASVVGMSFSADIVKEISGLSTEVLNKRLSGLVEANLIIFDITGTYEFPHDSMREACYSEISLELRAEFHQKTAEYLDRHAINEAKSFDSSTGAVAQEQAFSDTLADIYTVAFHYRQGLRERLPKRTFATNLAAGQGALKTRAFVEAQKCLDVCIALYDANSALALNPVELYLSLGQMNRLLGNIPKSATMFRLALDHESDQVERAQIHSYMVELYIGAAFSQNENPMDLAEQELVNGLRCLGCYIKPLVWHCASGFFMWLVYLFLNAFNIGAGSARGRTKKRYEVLCQLFALSAKLYFCIHKDIAAFPSAYRSLPYAYFLGTSRHAVRQKAYYSAGMAFAGLKKRSEYHDALAFKMAGELDDKVTTAELYLDIGVKYLYSLNSEKTIEYALKAIRDFREWLAIDSFFAACEVLSPEYCPRGQLVPLKEMIDIRNRYLEARRLQTAQTEAVVEGAELVYEVFSGNLKQARIHQDSLCRQLQDAKFIAYLQNTPYWFLFIYYTEDSEVSVEWLDTLADQFSALGQSPITSNLDARRVFSYLAYARLHQYIRSDLSPVYRKKVVQALRNAGMASWEPMCKGFYWLTRAALARLDGHHDRAEKYLARAFHWSEIGLNPWCHFEAQCEKARLSMATGKPLTAQTDAQGAYALALSMKWALKAKQTQKEFDLKSIDSGNFSQTSVRSGQFVGGLLGGRLAESLLKVSLASASSTEPSEQSRAALDELNLVINSQKAFLFIHDPATGTLKFERGRTADLQDVFELDQYSSTVVETVARTREPLIVDNLQQNQTLFSHSIFAHNIKSIMATPLMIRDQFLGVVYADSTVAKGLFNKDDLVIFTGISNHIAIAIESARAARIEVERREMAKDLAISAAVQRYFLPNQPTFQNQLASLSGFYRPATQCGGDWWWYREDTDGSVEVLLGDVTGHGAGPAMITAAVAGALHSGIL